MIICIGPFCIPIYWGFPFFAAVFLAIRDWFSRVVFGQKQQPSVVLPETIQEERMLQVQDLDQWNRLLTEKERVVVDFSATWCGPCKKVAPIFADLSSRFSSITFAKVDIEVLEQAADEHEVSVLPTFLFFRNRVVVDRLSGADAGSLSRKVVDLSKS